MAVTTTVTRLNVYVKLNNGTKTDGTPKPLLSLSLGAIDKTAFDASKAMAIANLLEPCLEKTINTVEKYEVSTISD